MVDVRVSSLGRNVRLNDLAEFDLGFTNLNRLHEHGLVIPDYNSWAGHDWAVVPNLGHEPLPSSSIRVASGHCSRGPSTARTGRSRSRESHSPWLATNSRGSSNSSQCRGTQPISSGSFQALELEMRDVTDLL